MTEEVLETEERHTYLTREVPGLFCIFLCITLFLALVSYSPSDPSFSTYSTADKGREVHNFIGLAGAYITSMVVDLFGLGSFFGVGLLIVLAWRCFRGRPFHHPVIVPLGLVLMFITLGIIFSLFFNRLESFWAQTPGGGLMGDFLSRQFVHAFNKVGAWLIVLALFILSLILSTGFSVVEGVVMLVRKYHSAKTYVDEKRSNKQAEDEISNRLSESVDKLVVRDEPKIKTKPAKKPPEPVQEVFDFSLPEAGRYRLPPVDLLDDPVKSAKVMSKETLMDNARQVETKLSDFNVSGEVIEVSGGPVITMYEYQPAPGIKISKVAGLADDLAMNMRAEAIRIVAPIPGKAAIGIEIPNDQREFVFMKEIVASPVFRDAKSLLTLVLGVDTMGHPEVADLAKMPHLLIAGATGSGKSVGLNAIIMSILYRATPEEVRFLMIDPKRIELTLYKDLPHLIYPVVSDPKDATQALRWAVAEMEHRYELLAAKGARNISQYNKIIKKELADYKPPPPKPVDPDEEGEAEFQAPEPEPPQPLPLLIIIIDELADLMMVAAKDVETYIMRLAQMARAAGIHLILATQRPSVDVLTGVIKANLPTRISFQVSSKIDSRTILDSTGAEKLLGMGDMLFLPPGTSKIKRVHGAFVSEAEIQKATDFIRAQAEPDYIEDLTVEEEDGVSDEEGQEYDEKYDEAVELVTKSGKASISLIQRHLRIGYNRAARIIEVMEKDGVVGPADGARPREVLAREL